MKKLYAIVALVALAASGCSGGTQASSASSAAAEVTPTPTPTPTVMSIDEAGKAYLAAVCPSNVQSDKSMAVAQAKPFDLQAAKAEAAALRDAYRVAIKSLSDENTLWPESVKSDVATVAEGMYGNISHAGDLANQTTDANFIAAWNDWKASPDVAAAAQKIRLKLDLSPDTASSCAK